MRRLCQAGVAGGAARARRGSHTADSSGFGEALVEGEARAGEGAGTVRTVPHTHPAGALVDGEQPKVTGVCWVSTVLPQGPSVAVSVT